MIKIPDELTINYNAFSKKSAKVLADNIAAFRGSEKLVESYARIAAINALKVDIVEPHFDEGAAHFFFEAHNDILLSHVNASFGSWRPALQLLRSFMENSMAAIYYSDHPVEFQKWENKSFNISPRELREYIASHPKIIELSKTLDLKKLLDE